MVGQVNAKEILAAQSANHQEETRKAKVRVKIVTAQVSNAETEASPRAVITQGSVKVSAVVPDQTHVREGQDPHAGTAAVIEAAAMTGMRGRGQATANDTFSL